MDVSGQSAEVHIRTDANNLITTAQTTHLPEQKETIHQINMLRVESNSGAMDDLAHVASEDCLADCLTKASAKDDALIRAVSTGVLPKVDKNPPFRELMANKHKAYMTLASWSLSNLEMPTHIVEFMGMYIEPQIRQCLAMHARGVAL